MSAAYDTRRLPPMDTGSRFIPVMSGSPFPADVRSYSPAVIQHPSVRGAVCENHAWTSAPGLRGASLGSAPLFPFIDDAVAPPFRSSLPPSSWSSTVSADGGISRIKSSPRMEEYVSSRLNKALMANARLLCKWKSLFVDKSQSGGHSHVVGTRDVPPDGRQPIYATGNDHAPSSMPSLEVCASERSSRSSVPEIFFSRPLVGEQMRCKVLPEPPIESPLLVSANAAAEVAPGSRDVPNICADDTCVSSQRSAACDSDIDSNRFSVVDLGPAILAECSRGMKNKEQKNANGRRRGSESSSESVVAKSSEDATASLSRQESQETHSWKSPETNRMRGGSLPSIPSEALVLARWQRATLRGTSRQAAAQASECAVLRSELAEVEAELVDTRKAHSQQLSSIRAEELEVLNAAASAGPEWSVECAGGHEDNLGVDTSAKATEFDDLVASCAQMRREKEEADDSTEHVRYRLDAFEEEVTNLLGVRAKARNEIREKSEETFRMKVQLETYEAEYLQIKSEASQYASSLAFARQAASKITGKNRKLAQVASGSSRLPDAYSNDVLWAETEGARQEEVQAVSRATAANARAVAADRVASELRFQNKQIRAELQEASDEHSALAHARLMLHGEWRASKESERKMKRQIACADEEACKKREVEEDLQSQIARLRIELPEEMERFKLEEAEAEAAALEEIQYSKEELELSSAQLREEVIAATRRAEDADKKVRTSSATLAKMRADASNHAANVDRLTTELKSSSRTNLDLQSEARILEDRNKHWKEEAAQNAAAVIAATQSSEYQLSQKISRDHFTGISLGNSRDMAVAQSREMLNAADRQKRELHEQKEEEKQRLEKQQSQQQKKRASSIVATSKLLKRSSIHSNMQSDAASAAQALSSVQDDIAWFANQTGKRESTTPDSRGRGSVVSTPGNRRKSVGFKQILTETMGYVKSGSRSSQDSEGSCTVASQSLAETRRDQRRKSSGDSVVYGQIMTSASTGVFVGSSASMLPDLCQVDPTSPRNSESPRSSVNSSSPTATSSQPTSKDLLVSTGERDTTAERVGDCALGKSVASAPVANPSDVVRDMSLPPDAQSKEQRVDASHLRAMDTE